ncbi:MAG: nucleotidyltransferase domain-containing protein [Nitrospiraceae bacterium]|nr:nucleotidyltransferase domain-containing protein [Nitrospiraceae bacterium]
MKLFTLEERRNELKKELGRITDIIIDKYQPEKIVLFGSFAEDKIHEWSDIDLLIIKETSARPVDRSIDLFRLIQPKVGIDLFIYTPAEYDALLKEKYSFLLDILKRGKVIYEKGN